MSRISFCNFALAKELFKRNWYVSALYLLGWLLTLVPTISRMRYTVYVYSLDPTNSLSSYLPSFLTFSAFFTLAYCVVAICVNCDYLFKSESGRGAQINAAAHKLCCYRFARPCGKCDCRIALHVRGVVGRLRTLLGPHAHSVGLPACYHPQRPVPALCGAFKLAFGVYHHHVYVARLCMRC